MEDYKVRLLRKEAKQVYVYNSGPTIYFFDSQYTQAIREANPSLLTGFHDDPGVDVDAPLLELGNKGMLVVFELFQDDEFQAELSIGAPMSAGEHGGIPWSEQREAFLSLPGGTLCLESIDAMSIFEEPADEPARVSVPQGDYVLGIQALGEEYEQSSAELVPEYYITLRSLAKWEKRHENNPFIRYPGR